jgi:hypothetical protein
MTLALKILPLIASLAFAAPQGKKSAADDADMKEIMAVHLDMDKINKFTSSAIALGKVYKSNPAVKDAIDNGKKGSIDLETKLYETQPQAVSAIKSGGISVREYVVMTGTFTAVYMAVGMLKADQIKEPPPYVSKENVAFMTQNYDKITAMLGSMGK